MITYQQLVAKTMPPEKKKSASRCIIGHYCVRPLSNIISIPLIETHVDPTTITKVSAVFPIIAFVAFLFNSNLGFYIGWFSIFIWNVLDGVDGNIARYNDQCSKYGELWDAMVGWLAVVSFYFGMGIQAYYENSIYFFSSTYMIVFGSISTIVWLFPRLVMQKKNVLMGAESVKEVKYRGNYGIGKLIVFNLTSINGFASVIFMVAFWLDLLDICTIGYLILNFIIFIASMYNLMRKS